MTYLFNVSMMGGLNNALPDIGFLFD